MNDIFQGHSRLLIFYYFALPEVVQDNIALKDNKAIHKHKCLLDHESANAHSIQCGIDGIRTFLDE